MSSQASAHEGLLCDCCVRKDSGKVAVVYCGECDTKMCTTHQGYHAEMVTTCQHELLPIPSSLQLSDEFDSKFCTKHPKQKVAAICVECKEPLCIACCHESINSGCKARSGKQHVSRLLEDYWKEIREKMKVKIMPLRLLLKEIDALMDLAFECDAEKGREMNVSLQAIERAKDAQLSDLEAQYAALEQAVKEMRGHNSEQKLRYDKELRALRHRLEGLIEEAHKMQIVRFSSDGVLSGDALIAELDKEQFLTIPVLRMDKLDITLTATFRQIELELNTTAGVDIYPSPKDQIQQEQGTTAWGVCQLTKEWLVAGRVGGYDVWNRANVLLRSVATAGQIVGCAVWRNEVITLHWQNPQREVLRHDQQGNLLTSWPVPDDSHSTNLTIVGEYVVVPNPETKKVLVYDFSGQLHTEIVHPSFVLPCLVTCSSPESLIVADVSGVVLCLNMKDNTSQWYRSVGENPTSPAVDRSGRIWVFSNTTQKISIMSATGQPVKDIPIECRGSVNGLSVFDYKLALTDETGIRFYSMAF